MRGDWLDTLAALLVIGAGIYLLSAHSPAGTGSSWFSVTAHGLGVYMIAKGIYMARTAHAQARAAHRLDQLVDRWLDESDAD